MCREEAALSGVSPVVQWVESACSAVDTGDVALIPGSGRSPGKGSGNPLQYSCLGSPEDRGAWRVTGHDWATENTRTHRLLTSPVPYKNSGDWIWNEFSWQITFHRYIPNELLLCESTRKRNLEACPWFPIVFILYAFSLCPFCKFSSTCFYTECKESCLWFLLYAESC